MNRKDLVFDQQEYVVYKFGKHHNRQPFSGPHYNIDEHPMEFHAKEITNMRRFGSSSLECELGVTKQSDNKTNTVKSNNHYLDNVKKYLEKSSHLMCFKKEHTKPINSIVSDLQRRILEKADSKFEYHEKLILSSNFIPQKYPTGTPVRKCFGKHGWFDGKVVEFWSNRESRCYKIKYKDGNSCDVDESDMEDLILEYEKAHQRDMSNASENGNDEASERASSSATRVISSTGRNNSSNQSNQNLTSIDNSSIDASNQSNQNLTSSDDSSDGENDIVLAELGGQKSLINDMKLTSDVRLRKDARCSNSIGARNDNHGKRQLVNNKSNREKETSNFLIFSSATSRPKITMFKCQIRPPPHFFERK